MTPHADPLRAMALSDDEACPVPCLRCEIDAAERTFEDAASALTLAIRNASMANRGYADGSPAERRALWAEVAKAGAAREAALRGLWAVQDRAMLPELRAYDRANGTQFADAQPCAPFARRVSAAKARGQRYCEARA